jgi:hypothetical protein
MKGQLPKAYLRLDPLIDSHADWPAMVTLMLWANRQPRRGYFKSLDTVRKLLGRKRLDACIARRDLAEQPDGSYHLLGWEEWNEGDLTVGERVRRLRARRSGGVTSPLQARKPPSEALGSKALGVEERTERALVSSNSEKPPNGNGAMTEADREVYAAAVWAEFLRLSGEPETRMASPGEWTQLKRWIDQGVPLRIVLRGMSDTKGKGARLNYYGPSVDEAVGKWRRALGQ